MSMFCVERRPGLSTRFEAWWRAAMREAKGTKFEAYVINLFKEGNRWLVLEEGFQQAITFFSSLPGWQGSDEMGAPLTYRKLTVSEEDARAEGINLVPFYPDEGFPLCNGFMVGKDDGKTALHPTAREAYRSLWDKINGDRANWASNPWVWVVTFKRIEKGAGFAIANPE